MDKKLKAYFKKIGRKGGKTTALRGEDYYSQIGRKGLKKRWDAYKLNKKNNDN